MIWRYTLPEFVAAAERFSTVYPDHTDAGSWYGKDDWSSTVAKARFGDESKVAEAESIIASLSSPVSRDQAWFSDVCGAYVVVPEAISGFPEPMRRRRYIEDEEQPINIYASILADSTAQPADMMRRGVALLALVMRLSMSRPVDLHLVMPWSNPLRTLVVTLESRPLCVGTAAFALAAPAFFRRLGHTVLLGESNDRCTSYVWSAADVEKQLDLGPNDLYLHSMTARDPIVRDPVGWINATVRRFEGEEG